MSSDAFSVITLEPIAGSDSVLRRPETKIYETIFGKQNRISIGHPLVTHVHEPSEQCLLQANDIGRFNLANHDFYEVELSLTLMPDKSCRFRSADFMVEFSRSQEELPLFLRLHPEKEMTKRSVQVSTQGSTSIGAKDSVIQVVDVGKSESKSHNEEWEASSLHLESFGVQTKQAGWRLRMTESQEIPLNTRGLRLLCVFPKNAETILYLRTVAEIEILSTLDRWMTLAFKGDNTSEVILKHTIR